MALTKIGLKILKDSFRTIISGSYRGELSSSAFTFVGGGVSGSSTSTGSFGRVEAAGVVFADSFKSVTGGTAIDFNDDVSLTGNLTATGNVSGSITSTGSFGRVNSTTIDIDSIQGNWTNAGNTVADLGTVTTADINGGTIDGITSLTAGGDLDIGAHDLRASTLTADSLTATRVPFAGTDGVLSDDSDLTFATATLSATNLTTTGTIKNMALVSGSSTSTGSFGSVVTGGTGVNSFTGQVGIGTSTPSGSLHLSTTGTQIMYLEGDSNNSGQEDAYIKFLVDGQTQEAIVGWDNNNSATLFSGNTENSFVMGCRSNLPLVFATNNTERMQIKADGEIQIEDGMIVTKNNGSDTNAYLSLGHDASFGQFGAGESGIWGVNNNDILFGTNNTLVVTIEADGDMITKRIFPVADGAHDLGDNTKSWRKLYVDDILFNGDSAAANALDDYEEGLHTTAITGTDSGTWTLDAANQKLMYIKIGRNVTVSGKFETDSGSGAGTLKISMPFTCVNLEDSAGMCVGTITLNRTGGTSPSTQMTAIIFEDNAFINIQLHNTGDANETYVQADDIDGTFEGQVQITYMTA